MEMNFPHTGLEWAELNEGNDLSAQLADQQALFARAIARQAASQSAQIFVAARQGLLGTKPVARSSFMEDRMAFFAGKERSNMTGRKTRTLFKTGCFRPDIAGQNIDGIYG
ncbi:hypothetical protein [Parasphingorhabdus sp.]|uniref:hypothetical protein n=1 Tax=Parasphingorhabdus sp. TaxID=2709688 RepID=UPI003266BA3B